MKPIKPKSSGRTPIKPDISGNIDWKPTQATKRFSLYDPKLNCFGILHATPTLLSLQIYLGAVGRIFDMNLYGGSWELQQRVDSGEELRKEVVSICAQMGIPTIIRALVESLKKEGKWEGSLPGPESFRKYKQIESGNG